MITTPAGGGYGGYVDLQVNGYGGVNFSAPDLTQADFIKACSQLVALGTEVFLPTLVTSSNEVYRRNLRLISTTVRSEGIDDHVPGIHLEGPFISPTPGAVGAHNPEWVTPPTVEYLQSLVTWSDDMVRVVTLAPEMPGSVEVLRFCTQHNIIGALGHTVATEDDIHRAADAGAQLFTHLGNGIPNMLPRHPNTLWSVLADERIGVSLIADGHHLPAEFITVAIKSKGIVNTFIVSDGTHVSGLEPGTYPGFDGDIVLEDNGKLHNPRRGCLAGSAATMSDCVSFIRRRHLLDTEGIEMTCSTNQKRLLNL